MKRVLLTITIMFITMTLNADKLAITLGTPWLGVKYNITTRFSAELRNVTDTDLSIPTLRGCYNFYYNEKLTGFAGLEYGTISFKSDNVSGNGNMVSAFIGSEYKILSKMFIQADIGYSTINLKSSDYSVAGPEWILNLGVNYYLK